MNYGRSIRTSSLVHFEAPAPQMGAPAMAVAVAAAAEVRERPGTWGRIATYRSPASASSFVSRLRHRLAESAGGRFHFTVRSRPDGHADVYLIWLPAETPS